MSEITYIPGRIRRDETGGIIKDSKGRTLRDSPEPAPPLLDEEQVVRLFCLDGENGPDNPYQTLLRYRNQGQLRVAKIGKLILYPLDECLRFIRTQTDGSSRRTA